MKFNATKVITVIALTLFSEFVFVGCSNKDGAAMALGSDSKQQFIISKFDFIIQDAAQSADMDWKLLSAIAYAESRFNEQARSGAGALGLMQVMPIVARNHGVPIEEVYDPETNVSLAVSVLKKIQTTLRFGDTPDEEKIKIMLAGYNSGIGNLIEARKIAAAAGVNHNSWDALKNYGPVNNPETRSFVAKVMTRWEHYKKSVN